jgi:hypothetical protein
MKRHVAYFVGCLLVAAFVGGTIMMASADPPPTELVPKRGRLDETEVLMRAKLSSSQKVLEGLLAEDFTLIADGAKEMIRISEASQWPRAKDDIYEHYSTELRRQCVKLADLANKTNHEGAAFTYLKITTTCIDCHDYVRDSLRIAEQPNGGVQLIPAQIPDDR